MRFLMLALSAALPVLAGEWPSPKEVLEKAKLAPEPAVEGKTQDLSDFDGKDWEGYARRHARSLDWAEILKGSEPVVYIGEGHRDKKVKSELAARVKEIQEAKFTSLGFEAFGSQRQGVLDAYGRTESSRSAVLELLKNEWGHVPDSYMELIDAARVKLRLLALDRRGGRPDGFCRLKDPNCEGRDCHMVEVLAREGGPESRVLVLIGSDHAQGGRQPRHLAELHKVSSRSYRFIGKDEEIGRILEELREGRSGLFLPLPKEKASYDGFVFVP